MKSVNQSSLETMKELQDLLQEKRSVEVHQKSLGRLMTYVIRHMGAGEAGRQFYKQLLDVEKWLAGRHLGICECIQKLSEQLAQSDITA